MRYDAVFFDADETLFDFRQAERYALQRTCTAYGVAYSERLAARYHVINQGFWTLYENGGISQDLLRVRRFEELFSQLPKGFDCAAFNRDYSRNLGGCSALMDGALDLVQRLYGILPLYIATNGAIETQRARLKHSPLPPYIEDVFISEELGAQKPDPRFFQLAMERARLFCPRRILLLGDSLNSDMRGGRAAGLTTCWLNAENSPPNADCDYVIRALPEFVPLALSE